MEDQIKKKGSEEHDPMDETGRPVEAFFTF